MDVTLTPELIHAGRSKSGGWNKMQLHAIGIAWGDLTAGWIERNSGRKVTRDQYDLFLALTGQTKRVRKKANQLDMMEAAQCES